MANSQRLAELEARGATPRRRSSAGRAAARLPLVSRQRRLHAHQSRPEFSILRARRAAARDLSRTFPTTTAAASTCSGRSTPAAVSTRSSGRPGPSARRRARTSAAARADLRLEITRAFWALVTAREAERVRRAVARGDRRARRRLRARLDAGSHPAERRAVGRGAAVAAAAARSSTRQRSAASSEADLQRLLGPAAPDRIAPAADAGSVRHRSAARARPRARRHSRSDPSAGRSSPRRGGRRRADGRRAGRGAATGRVSAAATTTPARTRASSRAADVWNDSWDAGDQRDLADLGRRPEPGRPRRGGGCRARRRTRGSLDFDRQVTFEVRQRRAGARREPRRPSPPRLTASAPRPRPTASSASASAPASRPTPTCSTRRSRCSRRSSIGRARSRTPASPTRAWRGRSDGNRDRKE